MEAVRQEIKGFLEEQDRLDREQTETLERTGRQQHWLVGIMIGLSVLLAVGTAFLFSRAVSARLELLNDNVRRLAEGKELTAPMAGIDEIVEVDRAFHDMAETIRQRGAELSSANEALRFSNRELEQFASVASHDLQEPLRKIQAFGDRLQEKCASGLGEQGRQYLDRIQASAARMRNLIDALLTYSRVTTKAQPFVPVDLAAVARGVVSDLEGRLQETGGRVDVGPLPTVDADPLQMRQLLQNLIANGLKFHKPGEPPVVRVEGRLLGEAGGNGPPRPRCEIAVGDNGIGFEEVYLDRIFEVFQRLHGRQEYEGTGMGLAICRKIVERHGGSITAKSAPEQGATFLVTLPVPQPREETDHGG
jgi:light-regulated signal transduction histidine kinase (bacteriophytochrome)